MNRQLQCQFLQQPYVINRINSESLLVKLNKLTRYRNPPYIFSTKTVSLVSPLETFYRLFYLSILKLLRKNGCNTWDIDSGIQGSRLLLAGRRERAKGVRKSGYAGVNARYGVSRRGVLGLARGTTCHIGDTC